MNFLGFFEPESLVEGPRKVFEIPKSIIHIGNDPVVITGTMTTTWIIILFFFILFKICLRKLEKNPSTLQTIFEMVYDAYDSLVGSVMGRVKNEFLPYMGALISFLFVANVLPMFPFPAIGYNEGHWVIDYAFKSPTSDINTTLGLGLMTAIIFTYQGIKHHGVVGHVKHFFEPVPFMMPIEVVSELAKPVSISMRLFGNILAGVVIMEIFYKFASMIPLLPLVVAPMHLYFDLFVSLVQSFIFTMLTMIFIMQKIGDEEDKKAHAH